MVGNKKVVKKKKPLFTVDPVPQVGLHRFSKKWSEPPRRHHTNGSSSSRTSRFNPPISHTFWSFIILCILFTKINFICILNVLHRILNTVNRKYLSWAQVIPEDLQGFAHRKICSPSGF
jgi:cytochrome bd-type quinol oxidase subunit 1